MSELKESSKTLNNKLAKLLTKQALTKITSNEQQIIKSTIADSIKKYVKSLFDVRFQKTFGNIKYATFKHDTWTCDSDLDPYYDTSTEACTDAKLRCLDDYSKWLAHHNNVIVLDKKSYDDLNHGNTYYDLVVSYVVVSNDQKEHLLQSDDGEFLVKCIKKDLKSKQKDSFKVSDNKTAKTKTSK